MKLFEIKFSGIKNIFQILNEIMKYLEYIKRYIFIFVQFNFKDIGMNDFYYFKINMNI